MGLGADGHFFGWTNIRGLKRRRAWIRRRRDMDSNANGLRATCRASSRALRPMRAPRPNGNFGRDL
eukprot:9050937-Lingulodinium_polyedra.AAC.1